MPRDFPGGLDPQPDTEVQDLQWSGDPLHPAAKQVRSLRYLWGIVPALSKVFGWTLITRIDVHDDEGEHTPFYTKAYRWAMGALWGLTIELRDYCGKGVLWGAEILLMSKGRDPTAMRRGVGIIFGTIEGAERAHFDVGYDIIPKDFDPKAATLTTAFKCSMPCVNFMELPLDTWIKFTGDIGMICRSGPGDIEFWVQGRAQPSMRLKMATDELFVGGKRVLTN